MQMVASSGFSPSCLEKPLQGYKYEDFILLQSHDRKEGDLIRLHGAFASH